MPTSTPHPTCFFSLHIISYLRFVSLPFSNPNSQPEGPVAVGRYLCSLTLSPWCFDGHHWHQQSEIPNKIMIDGKFQVSSLKSSSANFLTSFHSTRSVLHQVAVEFFRFKGGFKGYQHLGQPATESENKFWVSTNQILRSTLPETNIAPEHRWLED